MGPIPCVIGAAVVLAVVTGTIVPIAVAAAAVYGVGLFIHESSKKERNKDGKD